MYAANAARLAQLRIGSRPIWSSQTENTAMCDRPSHGPSTTWNGSCRSVGVPQHERPRHDPKPLGVLAVGG
jgi:hypothetical protein